MGLWDDNGIWYDTNDTIADVTIQYFKNIYTLSQVASFDDVTEAIPSRVTNEMNMDLIKEFSKDKILTALKQMHPIKAPGPDGMLAIFFHKYWDIVGNNVTNMAMPIAKLNKTNISLIPKKKYPTKMTDFRVKVVLL